MREKIILLLVWIMLSSVVLAQQEGMLIRTIPDSDSLSIINLVAIKNNSYYSDYFQTQKEGNSEIKLFDIYDNLLATINSDLPGYTFVRSKEISYVKKIQISYNNKLLEKEVNFCNNNGICEPCLGSSCVNYENQISCSDCRKSELDGFCNVEDDNSCDPDCVGHIYDFPNTEASCFEDTLRANGCEEKGYETCKGLCMKDIILTDMSVCCFKDNCINNVSTQEFNLTNKGCKDFFWKICSEDQICSDLEVQLPDSVETCCTGVCNDRNIVDIIDGPIDLPEKKQISPFYYIIAAIISLILLGLLYAWKKDLTVVLIIALVLISIAIIFVSRQNANVTGYAVLETQAQQMKVICEVAEEYNMPGSMLLTIANTETGVNHYDSNGNVFISMDGGVGIMQQDVGSKEEIPPGPYYVCGNSLIDGRLLDVKKLKDNIECGALVLMQKCNDFNCLDPDATFPYYCPNTGTGVPPKNVVYKSWDIALRGYNTRGCQSYYFRDLWGPTDPRYIKVMVLIQSYVETFHANEKYFLNTCGETPKIPEDPENPIPETGNIPEEIVSGDILGYYYINPSFRASENIDLKEIHDVAAYASGTLIWNVLNCYSGAGLSYRECAKKEISGKTGWNIDYCPNDEQESACYTQGMIWDGTSCTVKPIDYDTSNVLKFCVYLADDILVYDTTSKKYENKPLNLRFALTFAENGKKQLPAFQYDKTYEP